METIKTNAIPNLEVLSITQLPNEVLESIFTESCLIAKDLIHLCITCSRLNEVISSNSTLWQTKLQHRWKHAYKRIKKLRSKRTQKDGMALCWKSLYRQRLVVKNVVAQRLANMPSEVHSGKAACQKALSEGNFYNFCQLLPSEVDADLRTEFVIDELMCIVASGDDAHNLQGKYFAEKSLAFYCHQGMLDEIKAFVMDKSCKIDLETGASLIAQWFQPTKKITSVRIKEKLDIFAHEVKLILSTISPEHPVLQENFVLVSKLEESLWTPQKCREILQAIEMFVVPNFNQNFKKYFKPENSYINLVLEKKQGIHITLCLTVMGIARRLGLLMEPVNFPHYFVLRWKEFPSKRGIEQYTFIDVFNGNFSMNYERLLQSLSPGISINSDHCKSCTELDVIQRMMRNLISIGKHQQNTQGLEFLYHALELYNMFIPNSIEERVSSIQIALHLRINLPMALDRIQEVVAQYPGLKDMLIDLQNECEKSLSHLQHENLKLDEIKITPKRRADNPEVKYSVGMIMKHKRYNYVCMIRGWDVTCEASEEWIAQMGVNRCDHGRYQPFYHVWVMDGTDRYAAEENLTFTPHLRPIKHPEVGRLFDSFNGKYYIPGPELSEEYPDDLEATEMLVSQYLEKQGHSSEPLEDLADDDSD